MVRNHEEHEDPRSRHIAARRSAGLQACQRPRGHPEGLRYCRWSGTTKSTKIHGVVISRRAVAQAFRPANDREGSPEGLRYCRWSGTTKSTKIHGVVISRRAVAQAFRPANDREGTLKGCATVDGPEPRRARRSTESSYRGAP